MPVEARPGDAIRMELKSMDSKINLLAQKIKTIEKNEEILGRTLVTLNTKLKKLEEVVDANETNASGKSSGLTQTDVDKLKTEIMDALNTKYALKRELQEVKYTVDLINPLEYATTSQVGELIDDKIAAYMKANAKKEEKK